MIDRATLLVARDWLLEQGWEPAQDRVFYFTNGVTSDFDMEVAKVMPSANRPYLPMFSEKVIGALVHFGVIPPQRLEDHTPYQRECFDPLSPLAALNPQGAERQ